ncbi:MAG TPA: RING finger protein [Planctomycetota bacterium]
MDPWNEFGRSLGVIAPLSRTSLKFDVQGRPAVLEEVWSLIADAEAPTHRLTVDLRGLSPGTLKIFQEGFFSPIARLFGAQDLTIGDKAFDALYVVKASPAGLAASIFGGPRRERLIEAIRAVGRYLSPVIDLSRESLSVRTAESSASRALFERMTAAARELTSAILAVKGSVLLWEEAGLPPNARCPVCGARFLAAVTTCRKCRTPHHHECWVYFGGCSTYACGQR